VAFGNIVRGVPINADMTFTGDFFTLLNPYSLLGGLVTFTLFSLHGGLFLSLKTEGVILERSQRITRLLWLPVVGLVLAFVGFSIIETDLFDGFNIVQGAGLLAAVAALLSVGWNIYNGRYGFGFIGTGVTIVGTVMLLFGGLFPRVMPSSLGGEFDLTIYNAASSEYTLQVMTVVALMFVPIVLLYQGWSYWVFRQRISEDSHLEY